MQSSWTGDRLLRLLIEERTLQMTNGPRRMSKPVVAPWEQRAPHVRTLTGTYLSTSELADETEHDRDVRDIHGIIDTLGI